MAPNVTLEPLDERCVPWLDVLVADPAVLRFTRVPVPVPDGFASSWVTRYVEGRRAGTMEGFAILGEDGAFLGLALAPGLDAESRTCELGYVVAPAARCRGVAREALRLLTDWALDTWGALRIELLISAENGASQRVAAACGYVLEGTLRSAHVKQGIREDTQIWSLLPSDPRGADRAA